MQSLKIHFHHKNQHLMNTLSEQARAAHLDCTDHQIMFAARIATHANVTAKLSNRCNTDESCLLNLKPL